jgi:hypothetical protein
VAGGDSEGGLAAAGAPGASQDLEVAPESEERSCRFLGLDGQGWLQIVGGSVIGLIALYSSYDHINVFGRLVSLNQQRGVSFIIASLAVVFVVAEGFCAAVAQLASRSRLRAENEAAEARDRAAEARERQAEAAERQGQGIALLRGAALLSARVQLEPSELNRTRLSAFLSLLAEQAFLDQQGPEP